MDGRKEAITAELGEPPDDGTEAAAEPTETLVSLLVGREIADVERALIMKTLEQCGGNRTQAAQILGVSVRTIHNKLRRWRPDDAPEGACG